MPKPTFQNIFLRVHGKNPNSFISKGLFVFQNFHSDQNCNMPKKPKDKSDKSLSSSSKADTKSSKGPISNNSSGEIFIQVYAKPGAKQNAITEVNDEGVNIQINAPPVEGSANTELVKYIAAFLGLKSSSVTLERGHKSRNKVLRVTGKVTKIEIVKKINAELPHNLKIAEEE